MATFFVILFLLVSAGRSMLSGQQVVDGWVLGSERSCIDIRLLADRCDGLVARTVSQVQIEHPGVIVRSTQREVTYLVDEQGRKVLTTFSTPPMALLLVEFADGSRHIGVVGCFGVHPPGSESDPLCPYDTPSAPGSSPAVPW